MMAVVTGGSGSGKSAFAEKLALSLNGKGYIYLATMIPWDGECRRKIERHRAMRAEKGFVTVEKYRDIHEAEIPGQSTVLLECMSNLAANELFDGREIQRGRERERAEQTAEKIVMGIKEILRKTENLVVVTNEVFSDGNRYDRETECYRRLLGRINETMAAMADEAAEVVYGIPVRLK